MSSKKPPKGSAQKALKSVGPGAATNPATQEAVGHVLQLSEEQSIAMLALKRVQSLAATGDLREISNGDYFPVSDGHPLRGHLLDEWIIHAETDRSLRMVGRGIAYLLKQQELPANAFSGWLRDIGVDRGDAYKCIGVARMYANLSEEAVGHVPQLEFRKLAELSRLPTPIIEELATSGRLEEMQALPRTEFVTELKTLRQTQADLAKAQKRVAELEAEHETMTAPLLNGLLPEIVARTRVEGAAMGELAQDAIEQMCEMQRALASGRGLSSDATRRREELRAALGVLHTAAQAAQSRLSQLLIDLDAWDEDYLPTDHTAPALLEPAEAIAALERYKLMMSTAQAKGGRRG